MNNILITKQESIEHCVKRARSTWDRPSELPIEKDYDKQDIVVLNLQRAYERALDMANHIVRTKKLGFPKESRESFALLERADIIDAELEKKLMNMAGFKNVVTRRYREIDYKYVEAILKKHADDLIEFAATLVALSKQCCKDPSH